MSEDIDDQPPQEYMSYNGLGRSPMVWGVPFMAGLGILCISLLPAMMLGVIIGPFGWLFSVLGIPLLLFAKWLCTTDDKALVILAKEIKWVILKNMGGNAKIFGNTFTNMPTAYKRKRKYVERAFKAAVRG
jgi:type IV secretion system protein VirB3